MRCRLQSLKRGISPSGRAWPKRATVQIESLSVPVLGKDDFIANKRAVGRPGGLNDLDLLEEAERDR